MVRRFVEFETVTNTLRSFCALAAIAAAMSFPADCRAVFHRWEIKEIFTNADGTVQFVEFFTAEPGEVFLNNHNLIVTSDGVKKEFVFDHSLTNPTDGKHFLLATAGFAALAGGVASDYSPLPANFFNPNASTIFFDFAHAFDTLTLSGSQMPKDGVNSLTDTDLAPESGVDNMVVGVNSPTNFAGATGSVNLIPEPAAAVLATFAAIAAVIKGRRASKGDRRRAPYRVPHA